MFCAGFVTYGARRRRFEAMQGAQLVRGVLKEEPMSEIDGTSRSRASPTSLPWSRASRLRTPL